MRQTAKRATGSWAAWKLRTGLLLLLSTVLLCTQSAWQAASWPVAEPKSTLGEGCAESQAAWASVAAELAELSHRLPSDHEAVKSRLKQLWQTTQSYAQKAFEAGALSSTACVEGGACKSYEQAPTDYCGSADSDGFTSAAICCVCQRKAFTAMGASTSLTTSLASSSASSGLGSTTGSPAELSSTSLPVPLKEQHSSASGNLHNTVVDSGAKRVPALQGGTCEALGLHYRSQDAESSQLHLPSVPYHVNNLTSEVEIVRTLEVPPLKDADQIWDAGILVPGNRTLLHRMLLRMWSKQAVKIVVFGGSMTKGVGCDGISQTAVNPSCSWPARLISRLRQTFPQTDIKLDSHALGGCGLDCLTQEFILKQVQAEAPPDLIILDFGQNSNGQGDIEKFIRVAHLFLPHTQIVDLWTGPRSVRRFKGDKLAASAMATNLFVTRHYAVPLLSYYHAEDYFADNGGSYIEMWTKDGHHPDWRTHAYFADFLARWLSLELHALDACELNPDLLAEVTDPKPVLKDAARLDLSEDTSWIRPIDKKFDIRNLGTCLFPLAAHLARMPGQNSPLSTPKGAWNLYEDRPGKPGWIGNATGEWIQFPMQFSDKPLLLVSVLRSYEKQGIAEVKLETSELQNPLGTMSGLWDDHRMRESGTSNRVYTTHSNRFKIDAALAGKSANFSLKMIKGPKFKVISVISC